MTKRFHVFAGRRYYTSFADYHGSFASLEEAKASVKWETTTLDDAAIYWSKEDGSLGLVSDGSLNWYSEIATWRDLLVEPIEPSHEDLDDEGMAFA